MAFTFMIVVEDAGELKPVSQQELIDWAANTYDGRGRTSLLALELVDALNTILDMRAIEADEYDPSDDDTPIVATGGL